jgi:sugar phosphate isomerase/epimerase
MKLSMQLYSARNFTPWPQVFETISTLGYKEVEGYGALYTDTAQIREEMNRTGLTMPTAHFGFPELLNDTDTSIKIANELEIKTIYCPGIGKDERATDAAGWRGFADQLGTIQKRMADAGIAFGWHNHEHEVMALADGSVPMQVMLEHVPELEWQADIAWIVRGGSDPLEWINTYGKRITAIHVKDIAPEGECVDEDGWADVGLGTMDWAGLIKAVNESTNKRHYVMEHDNPSDFNRFAKRSIENFPK